MGGEHSQVASEPRYIPVVSSNVLWIVLGPRMIHIAAIAFITELVDSSFEIRLLDNQSDKYSTRGVEYFRTAPMTHRQRAEFLDALQNH